MTPALDDGRMGDGRMGPELTVVVPAYEEGAHVRAHLGRIAAALDAQAKSFEIVLVDDGSRDATASEAAAAAALDPRIRVERHATNLGKGVALETGTRASRGRVLIYLDADLEIAPEQIPSLLARFERLGADVLVGSKYAEGSSERRPLHRVLLSRLYWFVTSLLFRLPIRDTQTGLKILTHAVAMSVIPRVRTRRWAWDIEVLVLAHRAGARIVPGPVSVDFQGGGARIGWRGVLASGVDTLAVFLRAKALGAYGRGPRPAFDGAALRGRSTDVLVAADDLGLSASVDRGILEAVAAQRLRSVSLLVDGPTAAAAARAIRTEPHPVVLGVHLHLGGERLGAYLAKAWLGLTGAAEIRAEVRRQVTRARALGFEPTRIDSHRHAAFPPPVFRAMCAEARALGLVEVRRPAPLGSWRVGKGPAGFVKGACLLLCGLATRGVPRAFALASPDGVVDLERADRWTRLGRLPRGLRGARLEVIAHPALGANDVPAAERGPDRSADAARLVGLRARLEAIGWNLAGRGNPAPVPAVRLRAQRRFP